MPEESALFGLLNSLAGAMWGLILLPAAGNPVVFGYLWTIPVDLAPPTSPAIADFLGQYPPRDPKFAGCRSGTRPGRRDPGHNRRFVLRNERVESRACARKQAELGAVVAALRRALIRCR